MGAFLTDCLSIFTNYVGDLHFCFTTFTSLGYGDIVPQGSIRYLTGIQALTGLVLITWTASFLFIEMRRYWDLDKLEAAHEKRSDKA